MYAFNDEVTSTIEELTLNDVSTEFVSFLLAKVKFPRLRNVILNFQDSKLDLWQVLCQLQNLAELTNLTLTRLTDWTIERVMPFKFDKLKVLKIDCDATGIELDNLFSTMPNLIELHFSG